MTGPGWLLDLSPEDRNEATRTARRTMTAAQYEAWRLHGLGWGRRRMSVVLGVSPEAVRGRLDAAWRSLDRAVR